MFQEQVRVAVVFDTGRKIRPVWFDWRNRKHTIRETTYCWEDFRGQSRCLHFAVSDGEALFELTYDTSDQSWRLSAVSGE